MSDVVLAHGLRRPAGAGADSGESIQRKAKLKSIATWLSRLLQIVWHIMASPWRLLQIIRRSMTAASVAVLLSGIMTLNIIWGYPWAGMFAACISLMCVGMAVNFGMRPQLQIDFSLPTYTPAGQPCSIVAHCKNGRRIPAFDFSIGLVPVSRARQNESEKTIEGIRSAYFPIARPGDRNDVASMVVFQRRGIRTVPDVCVTTTFPFHLFRNKQIIASTATIAVTPRPLRGDEDAAARALLHAIGGWSHRLLAGDALDYTGSREYQPGMPVQRWDFSSWARLGRPIVREYQSPSLKSVLLIVDTAIGDRHEPEHGAELMERALSLAATAINDLTGKSIRVQLYVTSEQVSEQWFSGSSAVDVSSLLIRLAEARPVEQSTADDRMRQVMVDAPSGPTMLVTSRDDAEAIEDLQNTMDVLCVDQPSESQNADSIGDDRRQVRRDRAHKWSRGAGAATKSQPIYLHRSQQ